ncbi:MAG: radical SAM protein [Bdellovibrionales bacterium]|nr:radical SAM protein [Bdellovibrionales bacterium]
MKTFNLPLYHWHFEVSSKCALQCPRCPRTERKGDYKVTELSLDFIKNLTEDPLFRNQALKLTFCGGQGDPIYNSQFLQIIEHLKMEFPQILITIVTNGSHRKTDWWRRLGGLLTAGDDITFSLDGWDQASNEKYRVGSDWQSILAAIEVLRGREAMLIWNAIYFRFNQNEIERMSRLAEDLGFDGFRLTKSHLFGSHGHQQYMDPELGYDPLEPDETLVSQWGKTEKSKIWFTKGSERFQNFNKKYASFNAMKKELTDGLRAKQSAYRLLPNCLIGFRGCYVDAEGYFYPCSWVSHPQSDKARHFFKNEFFPVHQKELNLHHHSLSEVLDIKAWDELTSTWFPQGPEPFIECQRKCHKEVFPDVP